MAESQPGSNDASSSDDPAGHAMFRPNSRSQKGGRRPDDNSAGGARSAVPSKDDGLPPGLLEQALLVGLGPKRRRKLVKKRQAKISQQGKDLFEHPS